MHVTSVRCLLQHTLNLSHKGVSSCHGTLFCAHVMTAGACKFISLGGVG